MVFSELAADMLLGLSDETADSCAELMAGEYEQDDVYERSRLTYLLLSSLMMDYIEVVKLEKGNKLHEALVTGWGRLVRVFSRSFTYAELCQYCDRGLIPVQLKHMLHTVPSGFDENGILELPKMKADNMITVITFVKDHLFMASCGDDACDDLVKAGMILSALGKGLPPGTRLQGDMLIFPKLDFRQERAYTDEGKLFDLD